MLNVFKDGKAHLAIVCQEPSRLVEEANIIIDAIKQGKD
jgi:predicted aconitase with swiveling domain